MAEFPPDCPNQIEVPTAPFESCGTAADIDDSYLSNVSQHSADGSSIEAEPRSPQECNDSVSTLQLSLPESFDDAITLRAMPLVPFRSNRYSTRSKSRRRDRSRQGGSKRPEHDTAMKETNILRAKLLDAGQSIRSLQLKLQTERDKICCVVASDVEVERLRSLHKNDLTVSELACLTIHERISAARKELECQEQKAKAMAALADQDKEAALQAKLIAERREVGLKEAVEVSEQRRERAEARTKELSDELIGLKEKGRQYDILSKRSLLLEEEVRKLQNIIQEQKAEIQRATEQEKESVEVVHNCEKKAQILELDKSFLQKEVAVISERAERAENSYLKVEAALREATLRRDALMEQLDSERLARRAEYDNLLKEEIKRVRIECSSEVDAIRKSEKVALERGNLMMQDTKEELKHTQGELKKLRAEYEQLLQEKAIEANNFEKILADIRSELKVKSFEHAGLSSERESISMDLKSLEAHNNLLKEQLQLQREEHQNLDQARTDEMKHMKEELAKKSEQLEMYLQAETQAESEIEEGQYPGRNPPWLDPRRRMKQAVSLARKCVEFKRKEEQLRTELQREKEAVTLLAEKLKESESLLSNLTEPSTYVVETMRIKDEELCHLRSERRTLRCELTAAQAERDRVTQQLAEVLERREQLQEMKLIVEDLKQPRKHGNDARFPLHDVPNNDTSMHIVHKGSRAPSSAPWHTRKA